MLIPVSVYIVHMPHTLYSSHPSEQQNPSLALGLVSLAEAAIDHILTFLESIIDLQSQSPVKNHLALFKHSPEETITININNVTTQFNITIAAT